MANKVTVAGYQCEKCSKVYNDERAADICCKVYHCAQCGAEALKYHNMCSVCKNKAAYEKAEKLTIKEHEERYPDHMVLIGDDDYHTSVDDMLSNLSDCGEKLPEYCWGTDMIPVELDADEILCNLIEEANCEDLEFPKAAYEAFRAFAKEWNAKWVQQYFVENSNVVILIPESVRKEYACEEED